MFYFSSSSSETNLATAKTILSTAASVAATIVLIRSVTNELLPSELKDYVISSISNVYSRFSSDLTMVIEEFEGLVNNQIYEAAETYLGTKTSPSTQRLKVSKSDRDKTFSLTMERNQSVTDYFNGVKLNWLLVCHSVEHSRSFKNPRDLNSTLKSEVRSFELTFSKKHEHMVLNSYLPFILQEAKSKKEETKALKIYTMDMLFGKRSDIWLGTTLDHPTTFDTLALDRDVREFVMEDLRRFLERKDYYRKIGKAWKRGYLLYGPPGTGKSSLIAAIANYLNFDIYDLELTGLSDNSQLRRVLISIPNRSILIVEDIDCTIEFHDRMNDCDSGDSNSNGKVTLSGILNFIDGLWSSCGDERIIVFTTNHKEKLDPALLRPGRMDVHIHMSYCTPYGFRQLASNYLGIKEHTLFDEIDEAIKENKVTPAEVAEQLLKYNDIEIILKELLEFLRKKKEKQEMETEMKELDTKENERKHVDDNHKGEKVDKNERIV